MLSDINHTAAKGVRIYHENGALEVEEMGEDKLEVAVCQSYVFPKLMFP